MRVKANQVREETRIERYLKKSQESISLPASLITINFHCDENLAFLIRTVACFGIDIIHVIGSIPARKNLFNASGSLVDFVELKQHSNPSSFLRFARDTGMNLVSAELTDNSRTLYDYGFNLQGHTGIILGNETSGVPVEILNNSDVLHLPMWGKGFCLNTSQTGTAFVSEYARQYYLRG